MQKKIFDIIIVIILIGSIGLIVYSFLELLELKEYQNGINEILADEYEIEKKWLISADEIPYDLNNAEKIKIEQTYICFSPEIRVRKLNDGQQYTFTMKRNMTEDGLTRDEFEIEITEEEYNNLVVKKVGNTIYKTRYQLLGNEGEIMAFDIFSGDLEGLAYLEVEFSNQEKAESYKEPEWIIKNVTADLRYKNASLAQYGIPKED